MQSAHRPIKNKIKSLWNKPAQDNHPLEYLERRRFSEGLKLDRMPARSSIHTKRSDLPLDLDSYLLGISIQGDTKLCSADSICSTERQETVLIEPSTNSRFDSLNMYTVSQMRAYKQANQASFLSKLSSQRPNRTQSCLTERAEMPRVIMR